MFVAQVAIGHRFLAADKLVGFYTCSDERDALKFPDRETAELALSIYFRDDHKRRPTLYTWFVNPI